MEFRYPVPFLYCRRLWSLKELDEVRLCHVRLGKVRSAVGKVRLVFDFIFHNAYARDVYALTSILSSLSLIDMIYFTTDTKATPASVHGVGVGF
jgi:hypothetical protein